MLIVPLAVLTFLTVLNAYDSGIFEFLCVDPSYPDKIFSVATRQISIISAFFRFSHVITVIKEVTNFTRQNELGDQNWLGYQVSGLFGQQAIPQFHAPQGSTQSSFELRKGQYLTCVA